MVKLKTYLIIFCLFFSGFACANTAQQEQYKNDYLYSEAYFDYLIECASLERQKQFDEEKKLKKAEEKELKKAKKDEEDVIDFSQDDIITAEYEPFKLRIESNTSPQKYSETFKRENSKTIIPVSETFSFIQNTTQTRNKYNSNDYRILAGAEYAPFKFISFASGLETNYRGLDQNPTSRKLYFTPKLNLGDKVSLSFYNKINTSSHATDHDIGLNVSPFKSKAMDFGVYAGITRNPSGSHSESVNFSTNFYFF